MNQQSMNNLGEAQASPSFRNAYVTKPGFDLERLKEHCEKIEYVTDGYTYDMEILSKQIEEELEDFDAERDVLVPAGNLSITLMMGLFAGRYLLGPHDSVNIAIYHDKDYIFYRIYRDSLPEHIPHF